MRCDASHRAVWAPHLTCVLLFWTHLNSLEVAWREYQYYSTKYLNPQKSLAVRGAFKFREAILLLARPDEEMNGPPPHESIILTVHLLLWVFSISTVSNRPGELSIAWQCAARELLGLCAGQEKSRSAHLYSSTSTMRKTNNQVHLLLWSTVSVLVQLNIAVQQCK
jgi:hypothetical protein